MIYAVSEIGDMVDFMKAFPTVSVEEYKWRLTAPQIALMAADNTHLRYKSKKETEQKGVHIGGEHGFGAINDLGGAIF